MGRPRKKPLDIDESLDYQKLYEEAAGSVHILQKDLEVANRQLQVMQEDYNHALEKNQEMATRLHQMEARMEALETDAAPEIDADGMVRVRLDPKEGEVRTILGSGGSVRCVRTLCLNGISYEYECDVYINMPADHARILGAL